MALEETRKTTVRDAETLELWGDFLTESDESIAKVDEILLGADEAGMGSEEVNALFRAFHTIKGVAGFLGFDDIVVLAHATETLLDRARGGSVVLEGAQLDRVFAATTTMRRMLALVRDARTSGAELETIDLREVLAALEADAAVSDPEPSLAAVTEPPLAITALEGEPAARRPAAEGAKVHDVLKVDVDRVDHLVEMVGELIIVQSMVVHSPEIAALGSVELQRCLSQLAKISRDLQGVAMRMRMVPVRGVFRKLARMVRELSRQLDKDVVLATSGEGTEMDRSMVERLEEPLFHMIRNAMDHGIEDAEGRRRAGKSKAATIRLSACHAGGGVVVEVEDDGRGLSRDAILAKARDQGLVGDGEALADTEVWDLIFAPGFSTAEQVTDLSGRGVGMDVVKRTIEAMRGRAQVAATSSRGTRFEIVLPLTLAIIDGMRVTCGGEVFILPSLSIVESFRPEAGVLFSLAEREELVSVRGELLPLLRLGHLLRLEGAEEDPTRALVVVVESLGRKAALLVDDVVDQQQLVIKSLDAGLAGVEHFSGAAILSNGKVGLILNVDRIGAMAGADARTPLRHGAMVEATP